MFKPAKLITAMAVLCSSLAPAQEHAIVWASKYDENAFKVEQVGFSSDSKCLAVGYRKGLVRVFTVDSGYMVSKYPVGDHQVLCTKFKPGTTIVASGDKKGIVLLYDYAAGKELYRIQAHDKAITAMCFAEDGKLLITGSKDKSIKVWDAATGKLLHSIAYRKGNKVQSVYLKNGKTLIAGITGLSNGLRFYDINTGFETERFDIPNFEHFDVSPDGLAMAIGSLNRKVYLFNLKRLVITANLKGHKRWVTDVSYNNTGNVIFTASHDNNVFAWLADGSKHMPVFHAKRDIDAVRCSPDGNYLAILGINEQLTIMNVAHIEAEIKAYKPAESAR